MCFVVATAVGNRHLPWFSRAARHRALPGQARVVSVMSRSKPGWLQPVARYLPIVSGSTRRGARRKGGLQIRCPSAAAPW